MIYDFQKASILKRISAFLLDFILVTIIATLVAFLVALITNYTGHYEEFKNFYYQYEQTYGICLTSQEKFDAFTAEELALYNEAIDAMNNDPAVLKCYGLISTLPLLMITTGIFFATLIVEFVLPIILKNGQTVGKKVFNLAVISTNCVKAKNSQLFTRALLGKCVVEYMIPGILVVMYFTRLIDMLGLVLLIVLAIIQIFIFFKSQKGALIHDVLAMTAVCDFATQKIFESEEERMAFIEEVNRQRAEAATY